MVCVKCGQELEEGSKFCTKCGHKVINTAVNFTKETGIIIAVGVILALLQSVLAFRIRSGIWPYIGNYSIHSFSIFVLFGLLAGIICQKFVLDKKENSILKNVASVFLITFVLRSLIGFITFFLFNGRIPPVFIISDFFISGLIVGVLCSLAVFIYLKLHAKKEASPV